MYQKTISKQITFKGKGLHTGIFTNISINQINKYIDLIKKKNVKKKY